MPIYKKIFAITIPLFLAILAGIIYVSSLLAIFSSPWVPSRKKDLKRIVKAVNPQKNEVIYDLGSGDGRVCMALGKNSKANIFGIELSFLYYLISLVRVHASGMGKNIKIQWGNFYKAQLENADKIFLYLTKKSGFLLGNAFFPKLKKGAMVITYHYPIKGWIHSKKIQKNKSDIPIYIYIVGNNTKQVTLNI